MEKHAVLASLRRKEPELRARGVRSLYLFGSALRDEAGPDSDIDLFFDYEAGQGLSLFDVMEMRDLLEAEVHAPVDLMSRTSLHPVLKESILQEAERVF